MTDKQMMTQKENGQFQQASPICRQTPAVDIYETADELVVLANLPGVAEDALQIEVDRNLLTLEAETGGAEGEAKTSYHRQFRISERIDAGAGEAALKDGVLTLRLPKSEQAKPKKIAVKTLH